MNMECKQCNWKEIRSREVGNSYGMGTVGERILFQCTECGRLLDYFMRG